jgi:MFS transporter, DHA3 family, macrolide efflux protein
MGRAVTERALPCRLPAIPFTSAAGSKLLTHPDSVGKPSLQGEPRGHRPVNWNLILLLQGRAASQIGTAIAQVAILFWVLETTRSATAMGLIAMAGAVPAVFLGIVGGVYADRWRKKWIIVGCDVVAGLAFLAVFVVFLRYEASSPTIVLIALAVSGLVTGTVGTLFGPAFQAAIPMVVGPHRLHQANSLFGVVASLAQVLGQGIGGILYRVLGAPIVVLFNGIGLLLSAATELLLRLPEQRKPASAVASRLSFRSELMTGLRYVARERGLCVLYVLFAIWLFLTAPNIILLPILVSEFHQSAADWLGYILASLGVGNLLGAAVLTAVRIDGPARLVWFTAAGIYIGSGLVLLGQTESSAAAAMLAFAIGMAMPVINVVTATIIQSSTPIELIGRVSSVGATIMALSLPVGYVFWGAVIDATGRNAPVILGLNGALLAATAVTFVAISPHYRRFLSAQSVAGTA